ncbi:MAG: hypothetical protein E7632_04630 [Ruminococcaceae bacterium]|nr:hypothetical protein [Oscillospiraceae bacterium]
MKKNILALLLLSAMLASSACGGSSTDTTDTTGGASDTTAAEETGVTDGLGEWDFGGDTFDMLTRLYSMVHANLNTDETTGDLLNDEIYNRNRRVEDRFNFKFTETYYSYDDGGNDYPRQFLLAGDETYDLYSGRLNNMFTFAAEGLIIPAGEIPHIDHTKPYWNDQLHEILKVAGKYRFVVGDYSLAAADFASFMIYNKTMADEFSISGLYDLVREGKWTLDKFAEYAKLAVSDLDGNQKMDASDRYGYVSVAYDVPIDLALGAGVRLFSKDENDLITYVAPTDEKVIDVFNRIWEIMWDDGVWHVNTANDDRLEQLKLFTDNQSLFAYATPFILTTTLRETTVDFGVLPFPKWDEKQENYYTRTGGIELFGISYSNKKPEMAGVIMEAMACDSYNNLTPAYYDATLNVKGTRDEDSVEMLQIILDSRIHDYGDTLLFGELNSPIIKFMMRQNDRNFVSKFTGAEAKIQGVLDTFHQGFADNDK